MKTKRRISSHSSTPKKSINPGDHPQPPANMFTSADFFAGSILPVRLRLNVTVRPGSREPDEKRPRAETLYQRHEQSIHARLGRNGPKFLAWARRSSENATLFLTDPEAAAAQAGIKLATADRRAVIQHFKVLGPGEVLPAGVELEKLDIKIASDPYVKKPEKTSDTRQDRLTKQPVQRKATNRRK